MEIAKYLKQEKWRKFHKTIRTTVCRGLLCISLLTFLLSFLSRPSSAAFKENLWGARPASMVGAYTALADDANAPAYNPAGISLIGTDELTIMYARLYSGLNLQTGNDTSKLGLGYFSYVPNIKDKKYGSFGVSWANFTASNLYREDSYTLTYADSYQLEQFQNDPVLSYGANLKLLKRSFSTDSRTDADPVFNAGRDSNGITADLGVMYRPYFPILPGLKFGAAVQNVTEPDMGLASTDKVPARYSLGLAYQDRQLRWLNPALEFSQRNGRTLISAAWESWFSKDQFALRFGGNEDQFATGMGYQFRLTAGLFMRLDYALLWPLNVEGSNGSHRISLTTNF